MAPLKLKQKPFGYENKNSKRSKENSSNVKLSPSAYLADMKLSTDELWKKTFKTKSPEIVELFDYSEVTLQKASTVPIDCPLFQHFPSQIIFQNFDAFDVYQVPLQLQNRDNVARFVKLVLKDSPYFTIVNPAGMSSKVAPGIEVIYYIKFTPLEKKDYVHEVICITEREKFLIPIKAIGPRGFLDFPDQVYFGNVPVKYETTKILLVRNIGDAAVKFQLLADKPFFLQPDNGVLEVSQSMQIHVKVNPQINGSFNKSLIVHYDTGEDVYISMFVDAEDINIRLDKNTIKLENTYITSSSRRSLMLFNRSEFVINFSWKTFATTAEEEQQKNLRFKQLNASISDDAFLKECVSDPTMRDKLSLVVRSLKNQIGISNYDKMLYEDENIIIEPLEGEIWPNSSIEIFVIFKPSEAKHYSCIIYCDVSGRETRLPLRVQGEGVGPKIEFSYDVLDIQNVFINSCHMYELIVTNKGHIDAPFSYLPGDKLRTNQFEFSPEVGVVKVGECQTIQIKLYSINLGEFMEHFSWLVGSSNEKSIAIRGCVIGPTFHFDVIKLRFGLISYGFTYEKSCRLINTSSVPISFCLTFPSDGRGICAAEHVKTGDFDLPYFPKEFEVIPSNGSLCPFSDIQIQIRFTPLSSGSYKTFLAVEVDGLGDYIFKLPVSARSIIPSIDLLTPLLDFGRCFINYQYENFIELHNSSDFLASYEIQVETEDNTTIACLLPKGIIECRSTCKIPIQFTLRSVVNISTVIKIQIFGCLDQVKEVTLKARGEGPVIYIDKPDIDFGNIAVLQDATCNLQLSNESPIPAHVNCKMLHLNSPFHVEPFSVLIDSHSKIMLKVIANVNDNVRFQDKVIIYVTNGQTYVITLKANGQGSTIITEPSISPMWDVGPHLCCYNYTQKFRFYNKGKRVQQVYWRTKGFSSSKLKHKKKLSADNVNFKSSCGEASIFKLTPNSFSIGPGKYQDVYLEGYSDSAKFVKEKLFCQAIIGSNSYKENIMNVEVVANFIQPLLEFSEKTINFNIIKLPDEALTLERKLVKIKNISLLPLTSSILVEYPFQLNLAYTNTSPKIDFIENSTPSIASLTENVSSTAGSTKNCTTSKVDFTLGTNQELVLNVHFDPSSRNDKISWSIESLMTVYYKDHPRTDCISLKGEVHFPNLIFEKNKINFETVTNDTEHIQMVKVTNMSPLDVTYSWIFSHHDISFKKEEIKDKDEITICVDQSCISIGFSTNEETNLVTSDDYSISMADKTLYEVDSFSVTDKKFCHEIGIEEVFDIFPLFGCLKPKETLNFQFSFYGHPFIVANAVATCSVEEGPEYNVFLSGEASLISYKLNTNEVVLGKILYDQATTYDVQLFNTGSLKFEYHIHQCESSSFLAVAKIFPMKGVLSAGDVAKLTIQCVPIVPQDFEIYIMVQVAHFPSEKITIKGTGVFPHIIFNLPKDDQSAQYKHLHAQAMESLSKQKIFFTDGSEINEIDIQAEIDRLEIKQLVLGKLNNMAETSQSVCTIMGKSQRPSLTEYILDFGPVIYGSVVRKMFQVINIGHLPVSFYAEHKCILKTGFSVKLDPVKGLPGYPHNEHLEFEAVFSPQSEKLSVGPIQTVLPIKVLKGPTFNLCFKAFVTIPDASLSVNFVEFGEVICGQCKLIALQIKNTSNVFCHWHFLQDLENKKSLNKKTARAPSQVSIFELLPSSGFLLPGQSQNVNVKFMPREEANYSKKLFIKLSQSTIQPFISCKGTGKEPHIELDNKVLIFPPVLPFCGKAEVIVKVTNPCTFPVEFYSLEFDKQYLEEEKILQSLHCYDDNNMTLLPPRHPGDSLPKEILAYWEKSHKSAENSPRESPVNNNSPTFNLNENDKKDTGVGDLEVTPVASAIASYLGIDISFDINSNHHSLCVIIHGPPLSGKTATAIELSKFYNAAVIKIDEIVIQSIKSGTSVAAIRARELCSAAARLTKLNKDPVINNEPKALSLLPNASADFGLPGIASKSPSNRGFPIAKVGKKNPPTLHMLPNVNFVSKKLDINFGLDCVEEEFYNCILPEDILIKLLSERMQATDCATGIIFDGLESLFINDITTGAKIVLKAINNRKHIYAITLKLDFETVKDINEKKKYEHELQLQTAEKKEWDMLEEMNEDEYDALSNEDRKVIDQKRLLLKLSKYNKKKELKAKKIKEKLEKELEEKKKEEERSNKKKKNINQNKIRDKKSQDKFVLDIAGNKSTNDAFTAETNLSVDRHSSCNDDIEKKKNGSRGAQVKSALVKDLTVPLIDGKEELESPEDKDLRLSFKPYELSLHDIIKLLDGWDRTVGNAIESEENENDIFEHSINIQTLSKKNEKKKQLEKERRKEIVESVAASVGNNGEFPSELNTRLKDGIGIPHIMIQLKGLQQSCFKEVFDTKILPEIKEVAHDVSLKNLLPPFPFDTLFSVISCPVFRQAPPVNESNHLFTILMTEEKDVDLVNGDKNDVVEKNIEKKESKKQSKCKVEKIPSVTVKKGRHSSLAPTKSESPPSVAVSPDKKSSLSHCTTVKSFSTFNEHRWIIEPKKTIELKICFQSQEIGQFDQTLHFEIAGTKRKYQIFCRGICSVPTICQDPKVVFLHCKKYKKPNEIVRKVFILKDEVFEFGPLLAGKNRERYREGRYPENMEMLCISNTSLMKADITFSYLSDSNATTFLLEPSFVSLLPGENQKLKIWSYPKTPGFYEDTLVCCVKDNPEPVLFKVSVHGVRPELELDRKIIQFDRVLLHRKETRVVFLRNKTLLPAAWKLSGMENIGDDFTVNSTSGIIEPMSEFELQMHFRAIKAISVKKIVRVEVSDGDNVLGLSHAENITVIAEAYDIALDLSFPKGADGILDFGTLKVGDEAKLVCTLKNKGRYEISFSFLLENINGSKENINKILSVIPNKGVLLPNERPSQIQINFISHKEISISDMPILKCQVIEPNMGENGEIIACIPVKVSAKSIFSKYTISPGREINFGAVVVNTKKTRTFTIENKSQFDFRFNILKPQAKTVSSSQHTSSFSKIRSQRESFKGNEINVAPTGIVGGHNIKSNFGIFSVNPSNGIVAALNGSCVVTVDMISEIPMIGLEDVVIDISDRDPEDHPGGIEFRFVGEVCLPSILSLPNGASSIFEEHRIIKSFNTMSPVHDFASKTCIYVEDDNRFFIHNVIVGHVANVKFKITNSNKIPCDVVFSLKPISNKSVHKIIDVFEINMQRASIFPQSTTYVVVSFQPQAIQQYSCVFEAVVDGLSASISNGRNITFDIIGDGVLPHISILKPITTNLQGTPIIVFQRLILGHCQRAQVVLKNDGLLSCKCHIKLVDPNKSYFIHLKNKEAKMLDFPDNHTKQISSAVSGDFSILSIAINETIEFSVEFVPNMVAKHVANIQIRVEDNPFEDILIEILGEGYYQEFTIENINQVIDWQSHQKHDSQQDTEAIAVQSSNQIIYGDCHVGVSKSITFTVCNRSSTDPMRFFWDSIPELTFKPKCGHVQPNCTKDITVTYLSNLPQVLDHVNILCRVSKISLVNKKVLDWDDTKQVICWIDDIASEGSQSINTEEVSRNKQKKIVQIEEEPAYTVIPGSLLDTDLVFLVNCHYSKYQMGTEKINFKETYILQTRFYSFKLANVGLVSFEYNWNIVQGIYEPLISSIQSDTLSDLTVEQKKGMKSSHKVTIATNSNNSQISWQSNQPEQAKSVLTSNTNETNTLFECIKSLASTQILSGLSADERPVNKITSVYEAELLKRFQSISTANIPFTIEPLFGTILAGEEVSFTVRFSPVEIGDFNAILFMSIDNLDPSLKKPIISLHGQSALPWCHFELKESNYIIERRNPEQKGTVGLILDHNTKVIEFESCGVSNIIRKFFIMNPTDTSYNYTWLLEQHPGNSLSNFVCKTMTGCIQPGMKTEIVFEYKMDVFELKESLWQFIIKEHGVSVPFLLVAYGREPSVTFDRSNVNFKQVLTGLSVSQQVFLHNNEDQAFSFKFEKSSLQPTLPMATFLIEPNKGKIEPKNKIPITLTYKTESEGELNLNVKCKIGQKTNPLILNVKAEGVSFNVDIYCEDSSGNKIKLSSNGLNLINFLNVEINDKAIRHIHIENSSKFNLDFLWIVKSKTFKKKKSISCVKVIPDTGTVLKNTKQLCQVSFTPSYVMTLEDCKAFLKISNGPTYQLSLTGNGVLPAIKFSFTSYNFGPCFLYRSGATIMKKILHITNEDTKEISVECLYSNTSHLEIHFPPVIIFPGETKESEICFYPRDVKYYNEQVVFEINSLSPIYLSVCGQGIEMMVEVLNPVDRKVNLGFLRVNEKVSKSVRIVNNSLAAVDCTFALTAATLTLQSQNIIGLSPKSSVNLQSKATFDITIYFHPKFRISQFYEEVIMDCAGTSQPLFSIVGGCHGTDVKLDSESISFGSVTLGSFSIRKLVMTNDGDIGSNFSWDTKKLKSGFSIFPTNGYISSGMEVRFEITFNPSKESQEIRSDDFRCNLEDGNFLLLNLVGSCIPRIPMKDSIYFISHVRNRDAKAVFIHNKTNHLWTLKPVIDGEYWSGAETFVVEPQENKPYEIVYRPLTMTQETKKHNGSIFFPLPDGSGLLYNLVGTSEAPKPINNIVREVPCKIPCTELLNVSNWLKKPQRFHVIFEMIKPEKSDPATKIGGAEHIDVPGLSKKEYKVNFFAHKEGIWSTKVTFKNEASGEYLFYCLTFKVLAPGAVCCIDLTTTVRQSVTHVITINNPLLSIVNFQTSCNLQEVNLPPQFVIPAQSEGSFTFEYLPLKSGTTTGRLNLQSFDLGVYIYDLNLIANSALPERAVHFTAALGVSQVQTCKFINYARTRTEYSVKVDSSDFIVDKTVNAPSSLGGGTEVSLDVTYEPSRLGNSETTLILTSTVGGEYVFPLFGHCLLPKPQGPFTVKANGSTQIPFKNIFSQTISFTFYLDNPLFSTKSGEVIKPKKSYNIVVSFNGNQSDSKSVSLARLLVTCARGAGSGTNLSWTFYLKGVY
ncbi:hydrocephalus-inducing protein homolog isoform X4 [Hydra vulgaris]|uniref:Hydrocephalus-inducing protein homolog isoform X4 n=1 Tax=Hydra vulgaris TaxID=6087 RepID=A0ABM4DKC0_HYDVU